MLKQTKKDLFNSFWQLLEKHNLLLFCGFSKKCSTSFVYQAASDLDACMITHPDQVVTCCDFFILGY